MVTYPVPRAMGLCFFARPRRHSLSTSFPGHEKRVREWDVSLCRDGFPEIMESGKAYGHCIT